MYKTSSKFSHKLKAIKTRSRVADILQWNNRSTMLVLIILSDLNSMLTVEKGLLVIISIARSFSNVMN